MGCIHTLVMAVMYHAPLAVARPRVCAICLFCLALSLLLRGYLEGISVCLSVCTLVYLWCIYGVVLSCIRARPIGHRRLRFGRDYTLLVAL